MQKISKNLTTIGRRFSLHRYISYVQGQEPEPKVREYFYYINHEGMLFLDDARLKNFTSCFKDKKFLSFFFRQLKVNNTKRYKEDFPFISPCGLERNFIRCDDLPIVYTHVLPPTDNKKERLSFGHAADLLTVQFEPHKLYMSPTSGRIYHPAHERYGSIGLIRDKLAIQFSKYFQFDIFDTNAPSKINWNGITYNLDSEWIKEITVKIKQ